MYAKIEPRQTLLGQLPKGSMGAEIGVWQGDFSQKILNTVRPKKLFLIDPWELNASEEYSDAWYGAQDNVDMEAIYQKVATRFKKQIDQGVVQIIRDPSLAALESLPDESLDFVYIDGDHTYKAVVDDLRVAFKKIRSGGMLCGDDYNLGNWWGDGVVRAVNEFIGTNPVRIELVMGGQFMLRKQ